MTDSDSIATAIKYHLDYTPSDFYWQLKLEMAVDILQRDQSITTVCYGIGFNDPSDLCGRFGQFYGYTLSPYQKTKQTLN